MELKAFAKTNLLQPGQKQTLQFEITAKDLTSFDTESTSWVADAGNYIVKVGSSSDKIVKTVSFTVPKEIVVEKCNKVIVPQVKINKTKR